MHGVDEKKNPLCLFVSLMWNLDYVMVNCNNDFLNASEYGSILLRYFT